MSGGTLFVLESRRDIDCDYPRSMQAASPWRLTRPIFAFPPEIGMALSVSLL